MAARDQSLDAPARLRPPRVRTAAATADATWARTALAVLPAYLVSRLIVLLSGAGAVSLWGTTSRDGVATATTFDPLGRTAELGHDLSVLIAPLARWDSVWLLDVADVGYPTDYAPRTAFFPLYPLLVRLVGTVLGSPLLAGLLVSGACAFGGAMLVHRLTARELGAPAAGAAVWALLLFPGSLWLSAVYSEGLFLLLSAACVLAARQDRWALAGVLGLLAALTRSAGVVLVVALLATAGERWWRARRAAADGDRGGWSPRPALLAAAAVPLGTVAFLVGLALGGHPWDQPFAVQGEWGRESAGPLVGVAEGVRAGADGVAQLLGWVAAQGPTSTAWMNVGLLATLAVAVAALIGAARRLPPAYAAYAGCALLLPLSTPALGESQPLMSLPRFVGVLFPLAMWAGWWLARGPRWRRWGLALLGAALLAGTAALTARWTFVA
ncbi:mannosyltransferase family protein [Patulibacter defluvii]|uniref:mannosyltransferase family protein n=1 Tax=Patulibacter defluvii TaxID=3095358 RepID=UPI002A7623EB|nr:mannosyltransferase family protein [Patulibacter sp. DM4]